MASRLGQHLLRAKSIAENIGLFALYFSYLFFLIFFCLATTWSTFGCYWANSLTHPMLITAFGLSVFDPKLDWEGIGSLNITECPVSFDHNAITPQTAENALPILKPNFSKMRKCPQIPKTGIAWYCGGP